ncbi:protection of telomeres protein 1 isoform 2-T2 [Pholidichthys leucotaenia]
MSVRVVSDDTQVPAHLARIHVSDITTSTNTADTFVKGKVVHKGPLVTLAEGNCILKSVITEEDSQSTQSITVVLFGALAKSFSQTVKQQDVVAASGFTVGKSPTFHKDGLHRCNLLLSEGGAALYVFGVPGPGSCPALTGSSTTVPGPAQAPKYVKLSELKDGTVVNVYGVALFFKQPYKSRGTDFCSCVKITDESEKEICCNIFCKKLADHPKVFQKGDIVRLHRVKVQLFDGAVTLVSSHGFSAATFDGAVGSAMEPRSSGRAVTVDEEGRRTVEELRFWASSRHLCSDSGGVSTPLSSTHPRLYFNLSCQLVAKAAVDATCTLLRVWDGTPCPHPLLRLEVDPATMEGLPSFGRKKEKLMADVLVYDNHAETARQLKPGVFLRIFNVRATMGSGRLPGQSCGGNQSEEEGRGDRGQLIFHLHGGTSYGRGIRVLPEDGPDVQEMKRAMAAFTEEEEDEGDVSDSELMEIWTTPPETLDEAELEVRSELDRPVLRSELRCDHCVRPVSLLELKQLGPGRIHHVRVQVTFYQPLRLYQALKLYCSTCSSIEDVPDDEDVSGIFCAGSLDSEPISPPPWTLCGLVDASGDPRRTVSVLLSSELVSEGKTRELIFISGSTLEEALRLTDQYQNVVPVRSCGGQLTLIDQSAPFLFRGKKRFYGCKRCSKVDLKEPNAEGVDVVDEKFIADAVGVELLKFVLLMKLQLQDDSDVLDVFLWGQNAELFFGVSAEEASANQEAQDSIRQIVESLCPPGGSAAEHPWLDLCVTAYQGEDGQNQTLYQVCHSAIIRPPPPEDHMT